MWDRAGAPAHGSRSPETQSQLRKGQSRARGSRPGCPLPLRAARTPAPAGTVLGLARARGADRAGLGGTLGCPTPQRPARGNLTRDPRPRQARDRVGPPAARVQIRTRAPEPPLLSPVSLPARRTSRRPGPSGSSVWTLEPGAPRLPYSDP